MFLNSFSGRLTFEPTAGAAVRPSDWTDLRSPRGEHHEHQLDYVLLRLSLCNKLKFDRVIKFSETRDEHHQHQLDCVENSLSDRLALEPATVAAVRPRDWADLDSPQGEHHAHQLDCA